MKRKMGVMGSVSSDDIEFPVLIYLKKISFISYVSDRSRLVDDVDFLKMMNGSDGWYIIDNNFVRHRVLGFEVVCGSGGLFGYFFVGPFLSRRVVYRAALEMDSRLNREDIEKLFIKFYRSSQDYDRSRIPELEEMLRGVPDASLERYWNVLSNFMS